MRRRRLLWLLLCAALLLSLPAPLLAEPEDSGTDLPVSENNAPSTEEDELPPREVPADDPRFLGKSWDEVISEFLTRKYASDERVGLCYYNTVTGETHFLNPDTYFVAASLYKLPLNMCFGERIYRGEMSMDDKIYGLRYGDMQKSSLQFSANWTSETLQGYLGSVDDYVDAILPYLTDSENYDRASLRSNSFTPTQMLYALKLLYAAPERYPDVLYYLKEATPDSYFRLWEKRFPIAQKYGWLAEEGVANAVGVVWTDEPILLVFMSSYIPGATLTMGEYCVLMSDYSQYWHGIHVAENAESARNTKLHATRVAGAAEQASADAAMAADARDQELRSRALSAAYAVPLLSAEPEAPADMPPARNTNLYFAAPVAALAVLVGTIVLIRRKHG